LNRKGRKMNWGKSLFVVMLLGVTVFVMAGCGKAEQSTPAAEQTQPASSDTTENPNPAPPEGGPPGGRPSAPELDLEAAAAKLGVTEEQLRDALGDQFQGPLDLATAAEKLGVSEDSLREALGIPEGLEFPEGGFPPEGGPPPGGAAPAGEMQ
jgi:hypothetical protein